MFGNGYGIGKVHIQPNLKRTLKVLQTAHQELPEEDAGAAGHGAIVFRVDMSMSPRFEAVTLGFDWFERYRKQGMYNSRYSG